MGDNIPGEPRECPYYLGGYGAYTKACEQAMDSTQGELVQSG